MKFSKIKIDVWLLFRNSLSVLNSSALYCLTLNVRAGAHEDFVKKFRGENFVGPFLLIRLVFLVNFQEIMKSRGPSKDLKTMDF